MERPSRHGDRRTPMVLYGAFFERHFDLQTNPQQPTAGSFVPYIVYRLTIVQTLTIPSTLRPALDLAGKPLLPAAKDGGNHE